ncbi:Uncharacterised protein [Vibrio cholerae]|nr:Uncharacterised protein [Vibrio cholerae]
MKCWSVPTSISAQEMRSVIVFTTPCSRMSYRSSACLLTQNAAILMKSK